MYSEAVETIGWHSIYERPDPHDIPTRRSSGSGVEVMGSEEDFRSSDVTCSSSGPHNVSMWHHDDMGMDPGDSMEALVDHSCDAMADCYGHTASGFAHDYHHQPSSASSSSIYLSQDSRSFLSTSRAPESSLSSSHNHLPNHNHNHDQHHHHHPHLQHQGQLAAAASMASHHHQQRPALQHSQSFPTIGTPNSNSLPNEPLSLDQTTGGQAFGIHPMNAFGAQSGGGGGGVVNGLFDSSGLPTTMVPFPTSTIHSDYPHDLKRVRTRSPSAATQYSSHSLLDAIGGGGPGGCFVDSPFSMSPGFGHHHHHQLHRASDGQLSTTSVSFGSEEVHSRSDSGSGPSLIAGPGSVTGDPIPDFGGVAQVQQQQQQQQQHSLTHRHSYSVPSPSFDLPSSQSGLTPTLLGVHTRARASSHASSSESLGQVQQFHFSTTPTTSNNEPTFSYSPSSLYPPFGSKIDSPVGYADNSQHQLQCQGPPNTSPVEVTQQRPRAFSMKRRASSNDSNCSEWNPSSSGALQPSPYDSPRPGSGSSLHLPLPPSSGDNILGGGGGPIFDRGVPGFDRPSGVGHRDMRSVVSLDSLRSQGGRHGTITPTIVEEDYIAPPSAIGGDVPDRDLQKKPSSSSSSSGSGGTVQSRFANLHISTTFNQGPTHSLSFSHMSAGTFVGPPEFAAVVRPHITKYVNEPNRLLLGERTVLVMSPKVGQKSYGNEKRFLCPPPSTFLLGCSWWANTGMKGPSSHGVSSTILHPPTLTLGMSEVGNPSPQEGSIEWTSTSGNTPGDTASTEDMVLAGRCVGKQIHITDVDEKSKKVEALVTIIAPGPGHWMTRHIGTFPSKPIKVISKPSKKRQTSKTVDLSIHHGSTLALFNRLRSLSTKYLCVSGPSATFPAWDWKRMSGHEAKPFASEDQTCFIARTSAWDPFIVYAVDPHRPSAAADSVPPPPSPIAGYPRPPINALPVSPATPTPIYYNQPIVLQCLATGVISPIMIIRRVDKGTAATGGGSIDGPQPFVSLNLPVAPGETLGDPVSQLHKIALEIMDNPAAAYGSPMSSYLDGFSGSGTFLACLGENVGIHRATEGRKPLGPPNGGGYPSATPPLSASSSATGQSIGSSLSTPYPESMHFGSLQEADFEGVDTKPSISFNGRLSNLSAVPSPSSRGSLAGGSTRIPLSMPLEPPSSDGGKVRRPRRVSSSVVLGAAGGAGAKVKGGGRRRGASMSVVNTLGDFDDAWTSSKNDLPGYHMPPPINLWTIECAEPSVWTIVGTEIARHTFYVPPTIYGGRSANAGSMEIEPSPLFSTPIPATPLNPIPSVQKFHLTQPSSDDRVRLGALGQEYVDIEHVLTIYGENLSQSVHVWFGDVPSPGVEYRCSEVLMCVPPTRRLDQAQQTTQILLVRNDGIVFPTGLFYSGH